MTTFSTKTFSTVRNVSILGFLAIACSSLPQTLSEFDSWQRTNLQRSSILAGVEVERARVEASQAKAEIYRTAEIAQIPSLIVGQYRYNPEFPEYPYLNWLQSLDPSRKTRIYDELRQCIGYAVQGEFYFVAEFPNACQED